MLFAYFIFYHQWVSNMKINFTINKQQLVRNDDQILASYSRNFIWCVFRCMDPWCDVYKMALFEDVKGKKYIVDLGFGEKVQCKIPSDVLKGNYFLVSVFGDDRLTTTQETILVEPSGFSNAVENTLESSKMDSDLVTISSDMNDIDRPHLVTCLHGYTILKNPQHDEHLYL